MAGSLVHDRDEIRAMVAVIRSGGSLRAEHGDPLFLLHLAVIRYVNGFDPGDLEADYAQVVEAMAE